MDMEKMEELILNVITTQGRANYLSGLFVGGASMTNYGGTSDHDQTPSIEAHRKASEAQQAMWAEFFRDVDTSEFEKVMADAGISRL